MAPAHSRYLPCSSSSRSIDLKKSSSQVKREIDWHVSTLQQSGARTLNIQLWLDSALSTFKRLPPPYLDNLSCILLSLEQSHACLPMIYLGRPFTTMLLFTHHAPSLPLPNGILCIYSCPFPSIHFHWGQISRRRSLSPHAPPCTTAKSFNSGTGLHQPVSRLQRPIDCLDCILAPSSEA